MKAFNANGKKVSLHEIFNVWGDGVQTLVIESAEDVRVLIKIHDRIGGEYDHLWDIITSDKSASEKLGIYTRKRCDDFERVLPVLDLGA